MFHHYETMDEAVDEVHNLSDNCNSQGLGACRWFSELLVETGAVLPTGAARKPSPLHPLHPHKPIPSSIPSWYPYSTVCHTEHCTWKYIHKITYHQHHHISTIHSTWLGSDHGHGVGGRTVCKYDPYCMELTISVICHKHCCMISRGYSHMDMFQ